MAEYTWELTETVDDTVAFDLADSFTLSDPAASFIFSDFLGGATIYETLTSAIKWVASRLKLENEYTWEYTGDFAAGDRIIVDRDRHTVLLNGGNARGSTSGALPFFEPGTDELTYSDSEGSRTVRVRVSWRGRWL